MLFILGFLMLMAGFAMVVVGPIPLTRQWKLSGRISRTAGAVFLSFFPLFFGMRYLFKDMGWDEELDDTVRAGINWGLFALCAVTGCFLIFRVGRPAVAKRPLARTATKPPKTPPIDTPAEPDPFPQPAPQKKRRDQRGGSPFDFS